VSLLDQLIVINSAGASLRPADSGDERG